MEYSEKLKISSDFIFVKLFSIILLGIQILLFTDIQLYSSNEVVNYIIVFVILVAVIYYVFTRPTIYYDDEYLYIEKRSEVINKISIEKVISIKFFRIGQGKSSYTIKYTDENKAIKAFTLYPSYFSNPISQFIKYVKEKNPDVKIKDWSFGL